MPIAENVLACQQGIVGLDLSCEGRLEVCMHSAGKGTLGEVEGGLSCTTCSSYIHLYNSKILLSPTVVHHAGVG